jgi:hypothetical protein
MPFPTKLNISPPPQLHSPCRISTPTLFLHTLLHSIGAYKTIATTPANAPTNIPPTLFALAAPVNSAGLVGYTPVPVAKPPPGWTVGVGYDMELAGTDAGTEDSAPGGQEV